MDFDYTAHGLRAPEHRPEILGGLRDISQVLERTLARAPESLGLVGRHGRFSYAELDAAANRAAHALAELGVGAGDRVAACLPNDVDIVLAFLGCMRLSALWVGVNRPLAAPEKAYVLRDSGAAVLLAGPETLAELEPLRGELPELRVCLEVDAGRPDSAWAQALAAAAPSPVDVAIDAWAPAAIAYTSGTTGHPKGAVHSQHNMLLPGAVSAAEGTYPQAPQGVVLPLTILNLVVLGPLTAFQHGMPCVTMDRIDPVGLAAWVREERVGSFAGVPTILHDLLSHPEVQPSDLATLTRPLIGGSTVPEEFRRLYRERFGHEVSIGYGMTEAPTSVTHGEGGPASEPGLCGRALPQCRIEICDEAGRSLPFDEEGEICVGPALEGAWAGIYTPMLGYWGKPAASAEALRGGLYHSGDLGVMRADGNVFIRGRRNELILRGGANVYPAEVERVLGEHALVAESAVLGIPDARLGERVVAAVRLESEAEVSEAALIAYSRERLARYKVPERIEFVERLPRNAMQKVIKPRLLGLFDA